MAKLFNSDNFVAGLNDFALSIANSIPNSLQIVANDAIALIQERIQEKGEDYTETELPAYSPGYIKFKAKNNKIGNGKTNFTFTGDTMHALKIVDAGLSGSEYKTTVGFNEIKGGENKKAGYLSEQYGDILRVSKNEEAIFQKTFDAELQRVIDANGFGK